MQILSIHTQLIQKDDDLARILADSSQLEDNDIVVIPQKLLLWQREQR